MRLSSYENTLCFAPYDSTEATCAAIHAWDTARRSGPVAMQCREQIAEATCASTPPPTACESESASQRTLTELHIVLSKATIRSRCRLNMPICMHCKSKTSTRSRKQDDSSLSSFDRRINRPNIPCTAWVRQALGFQNDIPGLRK